MTKEIDELNKINEKFHKKFEKFSDNVTIGDYTYGFFGVREWIIKPN